MFLAEPNGLFRICGRQVFKPTTWGEGCNQSKNERCEISSRHDAPCLDPVRQGRMSSGTSAAKGVLTSLAAVDAAMNPLPTKSLLAWNSWLQTGDAKMGCSSCFWGGHLGSKWIRAENGISCSFLSSAGQPCLFPLRRCWEDLLSSLWLCLDLPQSQLGEIVAGEIACCLSDPRLRHHP